MIRSARTTQSQLSLAATPETSNKRAVEFEHAGKAFLTKKGTVLRALHDVTFTLNDGEFLAIVGPSGCGKSTTLNILAGLTAPTEGTVLLNGKPPGIGTEDIGYVFQQDSVLPWKTVSNNIQIGLKLRKVDAAERLRRVNELLELTGLSAFADSYPGELSGGMRKRVALAMTLAYNPSTLLMDEPFGALDAQTRVVLQDELLRLWSDRRQTVIFVTHDIGEAIALADRIIVMTARPARILRDYRVELPRPRTAEETRFMSGFDDLYKQIWSDLRPEIAAQARVSGDMK